MIIVQGFGIFETGDGGGTWEPCNTGLRAEWPLEDARVGYCVHKLVRSPADGSRFFQQNHCGMHRSDDGGHTWTEVTDGLPTDFGFVAAAHPHDRDSFYVIPLDPGHGRVMFQAAIPPSGCRSRLSQRNALHRSADGGGVVGTSPPSSSMIRPTAS